MPCLDVAVTSFWQLARHWKQGEKPRMMSLHAHVRCLRSCRPAALHPTSTSPCSCTSCKEEVSLAATRQEQRKREAKGNDDEADSERNKIYNIGKDNEKHAILSVSTA